MNCTRERKRKRRCLSLFFGTHITRSTSTWSQLKIVLHVNRFNIQVQTTFIRAHKNPSQSFPMKVSFPTTMNYENYVHPRDDDFNWIYLHEPKLDACTTTSTWACTRSPNFKWKMQGKICVLKASTQLYVSEYYKLNVRFYNNQRLHASYYSIHIFTYIRALTSFLTLRHNMVDIFLQNIHIVCWYLYAYRFTENFPF